MQDAKNILNYMKGMSKELQKINLYEFYKKYLISECPKQDEEWATHVACSLVDKYCKNSKGDFKLVGFGHIELELDKIKAEYGGER